MSKPCPHVTRKRGNPGCGGKDLPGGKCEMHYDDRYTCDIKEMRKNGD